MRKRSRIADLEFHLRRARSERELAYRSGDGIAADAHMKLSALHLQQALLLQPGGMEPVGSVRPFNAASFGREPPLQPPVTELPSIRGARVHP